LFLVLFALDPKHSAEIIGSCCQLKSDGTFQAKPIATFGIKRISIGRRHLIVLPK
jgi:hypothetical protein